MNIFGLILDLLKAVLNVINKVESDSTDLNEIKTDLEALVGKVEKKKDSLEI